jgi:hypothetical protein
MSRFLHGFLHLLPALAAAAVAPAQTDWQRLPLLEHVRYPAFAFDDMRGIAVAFGGETDTSVTGATWAWDRLAWRELIPAHRPAARQQAAMVFDGARGVTLLFGGADANGNRLGDTWTFDGIDWLQQTPAASPQARSLPAMASDVARGTVLLFGGRSATFAELADTWEWNGTTWAQRQPVHQPPGRSGAALACDLVRQRLVMFGGSCFQMGPCWRGDTWEWDGVDWTDRTQPWPVPAPYGRWSHGMAFDPIRGRTVLFGGSDDPGHYFDDTWEWDGTTWTQRQPAIRAPGRLGFGMAFDPGTQRTLAFGGETWSALLSDLWAFDGTTWQLAEPAMQPIPAILENTSACAYDATRNVVVWFGARPQSWPAQETWEWDGDRWHLRAAGQGPAYPEHHRLQWLPGLQGLALHVPARGAHAEQTWRYDGVQWSLLSPAHLPGLRSGFDLALDPRGDRLLLFGGRDAAGLRASTWTFDGVDWQQSPASGPSAREGHSMALDLHRSRLVLFGGHDGAAYRSDTWEWDGQQWLARQPTNSPSGRRDAAMTHDPARRRTVLHGGTDAQGWRSDTWEWDGSNWLPRPTSTTFGTDSSHRLVFDPATGAALTVGGFRSGTWRYAPLQPGSFAAFGTPCGGSAGTPWIWPAFGERPHHDGPFTLLFGNLPGPFTFAAAGFSATSWNGVPLPHNLQPYGFPTCNLRVDPAVALLLPVQGGIAAWTLQFPADPTCIGLSFFQQALALDPNGPEGLSATPGGAAVVGGR